MSKYAHQEVIYHDGYDLSEAYLPILQILDMMDSTYYSTAPEQTKTPNSHSVSRNFKKAPEIMNSIKLQYTKLSTKCFTLILGAKDNATVETITLYIFNPDFGMHC